MNRRQLGQLALAATLLPFNRLARAAGIKDTAMPRRIFITGSTDGLGRDAAEALIEEGHQVVLHARSSDRAKALSELAPRAAGVVIGDLASSIQTRDLADQANRIGRMD